MNISLLGITLVGIASAFGLLRIRMP
ncbi:hypothetical protein F5523_02305 [Streptococcus agalactiae]|nr:hypothetical protein EGX72_02745 [Streptococcus sp. FDAARGOS_521]KAA8974854.1 hypothetical protein F3151_02115 [Streptococcus agalactiae]KAA8976127.1 hypothetical protein F3149_02115 [Streptococcus agalactiae]KAA9051492.1 hypothetical protein F5E25_02360 [Streptococcus agalactiae]KAA9086072.1 hypothetical protein F5L06_01545 [Streptococcus agalactiae]